MGETAETLPGVTLLYGDDHQALHDRMESLAALMGEASIADLAITRFDGAENSTRLEDVRSAAYTLPFLTSRRMVIVTSPAALTRTENARKKLVDMLDGLPETTALILMQDDIYSTSGDARGWEQLDFTTKKKKSNFVHPMLVWAREARGKAKIEIHRLPALNVMPGWIAGEAKRQGGRISPQAAAALAGITGSDTGQARQEIAKLLTYVDFKRPVEPEDVHDLTAPGGQADVFVMVDALALGDARQALRHLMRLLEEQDAQNLFAMMVRQYRLIQMAKEARQKGITDGETLGRLLGAHPFAAQKAMNQATRYSFDHLSRIYHRLMEIDRMVKTTSVELEVAIQAFVAEMGRG